MAIEVGMPAPDFTLPLAYGGSISLSNMRGKPVVLYFYPKDDTPGCTIQACGFRDMLPEFGYKDAAVIGISRDSVASHLAFAKKYNLFFHLAADESGRTSEDYGVWTRKNNSGVERTTFLIDEKGMVRAVWRKVAVENHARDVLEAVEALRLNLPYSYPGAKPPAPPAPEVQPEPVVVVKSVKPPIKEKKMPAKKNTHSMTDSITTPAIKAMSSVVKAATKLVGGAPAKKTTAKKSTAKKTTGKKTTSKKSAVQKTTASMMKATGKLVGAKSAKKSTAKKGTATKSTVKKTTAKKSTAKKSTSKR